MPDENDQKWNCPAPSGAAEGAQADSVKGPKDNPAKIPTDGRSSIYLLLTKLFSALEGSKNSQSPIKFLSRYDPAGHPLLSPIPKGTLVFSLSDH